MKAASPPRRARGHALSAVLLLLAALSGCGKRGDPLAPLPKTPQAVKEVRVAQRGQELEVRFVAPRLTTGGQRLPVLEMDLLRAQAEGDFERTALREVKKAAPGEAIIALAPLPPPGTKVRVAVRAVADGHKSPLSAVQTLLIQPPPPAPSALEARLTPAGIVLTWVGTIPSPPPPSPPPSPSPASPGPSPVPSPAPTASPSPSPSPSPTPAAKSSPPPTAGKPGAAPTSGKPGAAASPSPSPSASPRPQVAGFRVYRRAKDGEYGEPLAPAPVTANTYEDRAIGEGGAWCYVVRLALSTDPLVESAPSNEACADVRDVTAPAPPLGVTTLVREAEVEVSWSPSAEGDLAGYRVYRAAAGQTPVKVVDIPAGETAYRDVSPVRGQPQRYTVTAVDASGNESAPSSPAEANLP